MVMMHVDDLLVVGKRDYVLGKFLPELKASYDISVQCVEKPGDELTFLKRQYTLHDDGRLTIQTHEKHITQLCSLLGLNVRNQNKKSPAHADIEKEDDTADLSSSSATTFRTCVGVFLYLANDVPQAQHVIRHLATYSSKPTEKSWTVLRHLVGYLCSHMDVCVSLKWGGQATGIFHDYPNVDPNEHVLEVFTDSDWASDCVSRRSVSCCIVMFGKCLIYSASRTQKIISLSSAEAEVYACSSGASDAILLARLLTWITNKRTHIYGHTHCKAMMIPLFAIKEKFCLGQN